MVAAENPHAAQGMVVLDIGGDIGALIVTAPPSLDGIELEICPAGARDGVPDEGGTWWQGEWRSHHHHHDGHGHGDDGAAWPHVAVLRRPSGRTEQFAAVFPGLRAGHYEVWRRPGGPTAITVEVLPAQVTTVPWQEPPAS